jgi:transcriptional regulator with XRE-family HTH domain
MLIKGMDDLARLIRSERRLRDVSQAQVATEIGISRRWLIQFESGKMSNPGFDTVLKLLNYLDLRFDVQKEITEKPLYPSDDLYPGDDVFPSSGESFFVSDFEGEKSQKASAVRAERRGRNG